MAQREGVIPQWTVTLAARASLGRLVIPTIGVLVLVWVLFIARGTSHGSALHDPKSFLVTVLNGLTAAALYFVVAAGFTLTFGMMRVVNMAHGSMFLLGGYVALRTQRHMVGEGAAFGLTSDQVGWIEWVLPMVLGTLVAAVLGLLMQSVFLRGTQGQELRQALITVALSIILADQMLAHFGGVAQDITWPRALNHNVALPFVGVSYPLTRLGIGVIGCVTGVALWLWLHRTRTGLIIRAGVDDRKMVSALGINVYWVFLLAFVVGAALAGLGGVVGGSFASLAPGVDANWLLNALIVVIIGGMGSLGGAAVGALLLGLTTNVAAAYLPTSYSSYSVTLTFLLLAGVLAFRPLGLFGRPA